MLETAIKVLEKIKNTKFRDNKTTDYKMVPQTKTLSYSCLWHIEEHLPSNPDP